MSGTKSEYVIFPIAIARHALPDLRRWEHFYGHIKCYAYVYAWLIRGSDGEVLVDVPSDADTLSRFSIKGIRWEPVSTLADALKKLGTDISQIHTVVITHMHLEHALGLKELRSPDILVQRKELEWLAAKDIFTSFYFRAGLDQLAFMGIDGEHQLLAGITLVPVPGHTPGSQAVLVRTSVGVVAIAGFCSVLENFYPSSLLGDQTEIPPYGSWDLAMATQSIKELKKRVDLILPLHDSCFSQVSHIP